MCSLALFSLKSTSNHLNTKHTLVPYSSLISHQHRAKYISVYFLNCCHGLSNFSLDYIIQLINTQNMSWCQILLNFSHKGTTMCTSHCVLDCRHVLSNFSLTQINNFQFAKTQNTKCCLMNGLRFCQFPSSRPTKPTLQIL